MTDADIASWFHPVLSASDRAELLELTGRVDAALRDFKLDYILYGGSLLGHCICNDILPWGSAVELLILSSVAPAELAGRLAAIPGVRIDTPSPQSLRVTRSTSRFAHRAWTPVVEVGFMHRSGNLWCHDSVRGGTDAFPLAEIAPTGRGRLGSAEVSVPARPSAVCRRKYGADCLTSASPPALDPVTGRPTGFPQVRVPLEHVNRVLRGEGARPHAPDAVSSPPPPVQASPAECVVLVASGKVIDHRFEEALAALRERGHPVRRVRQDVAPPGLRDRMAIDALAAGFAEFLWLDPAVLFERADIERLRAQNLPFVCGLYPASGWAALACEFLPGTELVPFGKGGGPRPVLSCGLGFALIRRQVLEAVAKQAPPGTEPVFFATPGADASPAGRMTEDVAFCRRARAAGFEVVADTSVRLWRIGRTRLGWEDAGGERERHADFALRALSRAEGAATPVTAVPIDHTPTESAHKALREGVVTLPEGFPRIRLYVVTYPANATSLVQTLQSIRESDWGEEPVVVVQPGDWPVGREFGSRNYKRALEAAEADGCDFALVLEDDVRVCRNLRHNLLTNPLVRRDQCDYLGLFIPDLIADPWERSEPHLGYRLAKPRYSGPNRLWERNRIWGCQGLLLSRRLILAALERWDRLVEGQDTRVISVCSEFRLPLWYTAPCLVEHAPVRSAFGTPDAHAPDYSPTFRLEVGPGFQPPEEVPGGLTRPEAELLWRTAANQNVLELGRGRGRSTVCLAQSARRLVSANIADQAEAMEWVRRYGLSDRVEFHRGEAAVVCRSLGGSFGLIFIDTPHDAASVARDIAAALPLLAPGGLLAFHAYPDPGWPDVRRVVDEHASRLGWKRTAQADFLGVFQT